MSNFTTNFWDERYSSHEYVYGIDPNEFFKQQIENIKLGKLLLPGEGEGPRTRHSGLVGADDDHHAEHDVDDRSD